MNGNHYQTMPSNKALTWTAFGFVVVFGGYSVFAWSFADSPDNKAGQFGDAFGALNTLISALAFCGVAYAILQQQQALKLQRDQTQMQSEELKLQRVELEETRNEMARSTKAQTESSEALRKEMLLNRIRTELDILQVWLTQDYAHINAAHQQLLPGARLAESLTDLDIDRQLRKAEEVLQTQPGDGNRQCFVTNLKAIQERRARVVQLYDQLLKMEQAEVVARISVSHGSEVG